MRFKRSQIFYSTSVALILGLTPIVCAQESKANNDEARGLLKRLENYEDKYLASKNSGNETTNVMAKQQEVLVSEVLRLRSQISQLEAQIAQGQEKIDFSEQEQKLISELTKERKRADSLEKELAQEKAKDYNSLNRELEESKSSIMTERSAVEKKDKLLKEVNEKVSLLEQKLQSQQELKKTLTKVKNESEQLELKLEAQKGLESDNQYLKKSLAEEKQKSSDLIKKTKELIAKISGYEQQIEDKKSEQTEETELKIKNYKKEIASLNQQKLSFEQEKAKLEEQIAEFKVSLKEQQEKEKVLKDSLKLTVENAKKSSTSNEQYATQLSELDKQLKLLEQQSVESKAQIEKLNASASELAGLKAEHAVLQTDVSQCQGQLKAGEEELARLKAVEAEMIAVKNELMLKNTASELLAAGPTKRQREIRARASQTVKEQTMDAETEKKYLEAKQAFEKAQKLLNGASTDSVETVSSSGEAKVLTVVGSKVNLRNGPGMEHSPVMQISEGSKLTMETKEGEWFRVYTPTGSRAYIHQDEVGFDDGAMQEEQVVSSGRSPAKAALIGGSELVPFGKVKVAGALDTEDLAIKKLKTQMGQGE